ncbi:hypothetical protein DCCM_2981 [Desulfocucumis palustris]|uniref:Uncharacterized protein n=1 Tax=Desulfocucumis palustris TaxID=1898651 RepID=A0A2L2XCK1_9FIRM|nr:hypothetical protein DCCM_2981 [Desulfocucumis palustris]
MVNKPGVQIFDNCAQSPKMVQARRRINLLYISSNDKMNLFIFEFAH